MEQVMNKHKTRVDKYPERVALINEALQQIDFKFSYGFTGSSAEDGLPFLSARLEDTRTGKAVISIGTRIDEELGCLLKYALLERAGKVKYE